MCVCMCVCVRMCVCVHTGVLLLPETFVILIFSLLNHADPPDVVAAQQVRSLIEPCAIEKSLTLTAYAAGMNAEGAQVAQRATGS